MLEHLDAHHAVERAHVRLLKVERVDVSCDHAHVGKPSLLTTISGGSRGTHRVGWRRCARSTFQHRGSARWTTERGWTFPRLRVAGAAGRAVASNGVHDTTQKTTDGPPKAVLLYKFTTVYHQ